MKIFVKKVRFFFIKGNTVSLMYFYSFGYNLILMKGNNVSRMYFYSFGYNLITSSKIIPLCFENTTYFRLELKPHQFFYL